MSAGALCQIISGMTEIRFILNVPQRMPYVCKMARKSFMQSKKLAIVGADDELMKLDQLLWSMTPTDFVAHSLQLSNAPETATSGDWNPVELLGLTAQASHTDLLLNLLPDVPKDFSRFDVLYELVCLDDDDFTKKQARQRWRYYQQRGYAMTSHDLQKGVGA